MSNSVPYSLYSIYSIPWLMPDSVPYPQETAREDTGDADLLHLPHSPVYISIYIYVHIYNYNLCVYIIYVRRHTHACMKDVNKRAYACITDTYIDRDTDTDTGIDSRALAHVNLVNKMLPGSHMRQANRTSRWWLFRLYPKKRGEKRKKSGHDTHKAQTHKPIRCRHIHIHMHVQVHRHSKSAMRRSGAKITCPKRKHDILEASVLQASVYPVALTTARFGGYM